MSPCWQIPLAAVADVMMGEAPEWTQHAGTIAMTVAGVIFILAGFVGESLSAVC